jgi:hypothetical protein
LIAREKMIIVHFCSSNYGKGKLRISLGENGNGKKKEKARVHHLPSSFFSSPSLPLPLKNMRVK